MIKGGLRNHFITLSPYHRSLYHFVRITLSASPCRLDVRVQSTALFSEVESLHRRWPRDWCRPAFVVVLLFAAAIRLVALPAAPPGLNQDEAANAWNAWCLLQTGRDQAGAPWPIFWTHALGENRSTLYLYALLPFQAIGGLNVWTTRLPAAVAGILTVALVYWIAARLFDRTTAIIAAVFAALAPWYST